MSYLECEIYCTTDNLLKPMLGTGKKPDGYNLAGPHAIAKENRAIFAINDDFFGYRIIEKVCPGVIIRNGRILETGRDVTYRHSWPELDVLAFFPDGSMKTYPRNAHKAEEYIAMGVTDTYSFGPLLIQDGVINEALYTRKGEQYQSKEPRIAIGMVEPCHYKVLLVRGRVTTSKGCTPAWLAEHMKEMGCVEAFNLDGGGSVFMWFDGDLINRAENIKAADVRDISSMMGFSFPEE